MGLGSRSDTNQLDYLKKTIKAYQGRDSDAVKYVKKVEAFIDKPLDLEDVRLTRNKVKFLYKLDISVLFPMKGYNLKRKILSSTFMILSWQRA